MNSGYSDTIELGHIVRTIARGWRAIVAFTLLGIGAAVAIILYAPPKFTSVASVILKSGSASGGASSILSQFTGLADVTGGLLGGKSPMETEIEILSSRAVVGEAVDSLRLQARPLPAFRPTVALLSSLTAPGSFKRARYHFVRNADSAAYAYEGSGKTAGPMVPGQTTSLGIATATFAAGAPLPPSFDLELRDRDDAIDRVSSHLTVKKGKGEVASVSYSGDDSVTAARLPNLLLDIYLARRRGLDRGVNQRRVEFLTAKSDSMSVELVRAGRALRQQQEASGVLDVETEAKVGLEATALLRSKLTDVMVEQGALTQMMARINAKTLTPRELSAYPTFLKSPVVSNIVGQIVDVETRRTALLTTRTEADPAAEALKRSADSLEAQLVPYARTYAAALAAEHADLQTSISQVDTELARLPRAAESAIQLRLHLTDLAKLSTGLQAQLVEAKLAAIGEGGDVRPLDFATIPKKPSFPDPLITAGLGTIAGMFFGVIAALLFGSMGRWVRDPVELERSTGVPAIRFDPAEPLLLSNPASRTIVVAPIDAGVSVVAVVNRLAQTAASRSLSAAVFTLNGTVTDANASIARLESEYDLVIVQLPSLVSEAAAAVLQHTRPVLLVTPGRRVERRRLMSAVQVLKRLDVPCAGIVMSSRTPVNDPAPNGRVLAG